MWDMAREILHTSHTDCTYATVNEARVMGGVNPRRTSSVRTRNERWLKTQSAFVTSSSLTPPPQAPPPPPPPSSPPHTVTDTPFYVNGLIRPQEGVVRGEDGEEEVAPAVPPKIGVKLQLDREYDVSDNSRRLHAMNVTIRRPSEGEKDLTGGKMSKEALLLRSGVTLRPGVRPPRAVSMGVREGEGGDGPSGSDGDDGLEPVTRYVYTTYSMPEICRNLLHVHVFTVYIPVGAHAWVYDEAIWILYV